MKRSLQPHHLQKKQKLQTKIIRISFFLRALQLNPVLVHIENGTKILDLPLELTRKRNSHSPNFWYSGDQKFEEKFTGKASVSKLWTTLLKGPKTIGKIEYTWSCPL